MGWFDEQIRQRIQNDDEMFADAVAQMVNIVSSEKIISSFASDRKLASQAIGDILKFYHVKAQEVPDKMTDINDVMEFLLRPSGIMRRTVRLSKGWQKDAIGAMLGTKKDGKIIALIPGKIRGYYYKDYATGEKKKITDKVAEEIDTEAVCFYQPFPLRELSTIDLIKYSVRLLRTNDYVLLVLCSAMAVGLGLFTPIISRYLYGTVLELKSSMLLAGAIMTLLFLTLAGCLITVIRSVLDANITAKMNLAIESATMMRVLSLPVDFFKQYSSGELANRIGYMNSVCNIIFDTLFTTGLSAIFSLVYIGQIFAFAPALVIPALTVIIVTSIFTVVTTVFQMHIYEKQMTEMSKESGMVYAMISGITKIKNAGAEKRAFSKWSRQYVRVAKYTYDPPAFLKINSTITTGIMLLGAVWLYFDAIKAHVSMADFMAFNSSYGLVSGAFAALAGIAITVSQVRPTLKMVQPIMQTKPEIADNRHVVTKIRGTIELNNVSFRYNDNMPYVLDNLSLKIKAGQYIAIVGKTGCGKSTLMRILLGFEKPQKGAVYYDGKDIASMDLKSLRQKIGVVLQNSRLFQGDIFSNIAISAPGLTMDEAWEAAELAGMAEDIRQMPMGMSTMISEGIGGVSGGQKQRLMIARAIAPKPRILMFDEATSALDNITQKTVSMSLEALKCTRIVIAHRLSTIKHCDRIIVLDHGKIVEDGTYEELLEKNGFFSELVERQRIDV